MEFSQCTNKPVWFFGCARDGARARGQKAKNAQMETLAAQARWKGSTQTVGRIRSFFLFFFRVRIVRMIALCH